MGRKRKKCEIIPPETRKSGVYAIINKTAHKCYIGEAQDLKYRIKNHSCALTNGKHHCKAMQEDYGIGHIFKAAVLQEIDGKMTKDERKCYEDYYIVCMRLSGVELYNSEHASNSIRNFFFRAKFIDKTVRDLRNEIISN